MSKTNTTTAAASRQALADAKAKAATWGALHAAVVEAAEDLVARLAGGDDTVTDEEFAAARFAQERSTILVNAGASLVKRAERALVNDDTRVADLFADVIAEAFGWLVPVRVVTVRADVAPNPGGEPVAFVLQEKPGTDDGGILSGELRVTFYRSALLAPLNVDRLQQAADRHGHQAQVIHGASARRGDAYEDSATIRVHQASADVPILAAAPSAETVRHFAQGIPGRLFRVVRTAPVGVRITGDGPAPNGAAELVSHRMVGTETVDGGQRLTVEVTCRATPSPALKTNPYAGLVDAIVNVAGTVEPGLGRVVSVGDPKLTSPENEGAAYRRPWTITARFVIAYAIAQ